MRPDATSRSSRLGDEEFCFIWNELYSVQITRILYPNLNDLNDLRKDPHCNDQYFPFRIH